MHSILRSGGRAVVSIEYNAEDGKDYSKYIEKWVMWIYTEEEIQAMMKEAGFLKVYLTYDKGFGIPKMIIAHGTKP